MLPISDPRLRLLLRAGFVVALVTAYVLALRPVPEAFHGVMSEDKLLHAFGFFVMTTLGLLGWPRAAVRIVLLMLVYGVAMEIGQSFVPARAGDPADWLADAVGTLLAWALVHAFGRLAQRRTAPAR